MELSREYTYAGKVYGPTSENIPKEAQEAIREVEKSLENFKYPGNATDDQGAPSPSEGSKG